VSFTLLIKVINLISDNQFDSLINLVSSNSDLLDCEVNEIGADAFLKGQFLSAVSSLHITS